MEKYARWDDNGHGIHPHAGRSRRILPCGAETQRDQVYEIKEATAGPPDSYLGTQIYKHSLPDGCWAWAMSSIKYVKNAIQTVETLLKEDGNGLHLKTTAHVPFPSSYKPELDFSPELTGPLLARYQQLIRILRWAVELGHIDIYLETSLLSQ